MFNEFLKKNINGGPYGIYIPAFVENGFGQVEPNHLSAQRTSQVYAQLPANSGIQVLQQGQFVKYDYASGEVNFGSAEHDTGEWMLVYNEIKLYRDFQNDCEFAMIKDNYQARVYSPFGGAKGEETGIWGVKSSDDYKKTDIFMDKQSRYYNGNNVAPKDGVEIKDGKITFAGKEFPIDDVTAAPDMYEMHYNEDPFHIYGLGQELKMPDGTTMVPRVLKTNVGDIFTTNTINEKTLNVGDILAPLASNDPKTPFAGILCKNGDTSAMKWQVVKLYTMPDHQPGAKIMRIA